MLRIALFADIHGKFLLPFKMVDAYQKLTKERIHYILQCGDMGAFPSKDAMDKATLKHARYDRDELGFMDDFIKPKKEINDFLTQLNIPMYAVRGNHECHTFLDSLENDSDKQSPYFSIDCYQKIWVLKTGFVLKLSHDTDSISLVGIGRIGDRKGRDDKKFIQEYERQQLKKLYKQHDKLDVLISHDKTSESIRGYGLVEIADVLNHIAFSYHFYGHTGEPFHISLAENGITQSVKIKELEFNTKGQLEAGCMLILEKVNNKIHLKPVGMDFLRLFYQNTWKAFRV